LAFGTRHDKTRQNKKTQDNIREDKTRQGKTRQDNPREDKTRQIKAKQGKTRRHSATQRNTRLHELLSALEEVSKGISMSFPCSLA
jgi:hypothetical protein